MTDIQTAIAQLREAIDRGATWDMISRAYDVLNNALVERHKPFQTLTKELLFSAPVKWDKVAAALTALESAVTTPDLTARIEAAAEEIDSKIVQADGVTIPVADIAAILRRHLEGGK